uniref:Uncharacterized protein n=1 Tax=Romanomermis culicivorax TaxID=13658 RepID=A0A915L195_ROMCU
MTAGTLHRLSILFAHRQHMLDYHNLVLQQTMKTIKRSAAYQQKFYSRSSLAYKNGPSLKLLPLSSVLASRRQISIFIKLIKNITRLRYLILGGAIGGGVTLSQKIDDFKQKMPDLSWIWDFVPASESVKKSLENFSESMNKKKSHWSTKWAEVNGENGWITIKKRNIVRIMDKVKIQSPTSDRRPANAQGLLLYNGFDGKPFQEVLFEHRAKKTLTETDDTVLAAVAEQHLKNNKLEKADSGNGDDDKNFEFSRVAPMNESERVQKLQDDMIQMQIRFLTTST